MSFVRGIDPKQALGIGLGKRLRTRMMNNPEYDYNDYVEVWRWALQRKARSIFFPYIVGMNGKKWVDGTTIDVSDWNNELLWISLVEENIEAVKALLAVPNLFRKETLTLELGTSELEGEFTMRGEEKRPMRGTNFGAFLNLVVNSYPNEELKNLLLDYYNKNSRK